MRERISRLEAYRAKNRNKNGVGLPKEQNYMVLSVQKLLSGSGRAGTLRHMGKYLGHRLAARPELDNTFWTDSTFSYTDVMSRCSTCEKSQYVCY